MADDKLGFGAKLLRLLELRLELLGLNVEASIRTVVTQLLLGFVALLVLALVWVFGCLALVLALAPVVPLPLGFGLLAGFHLLLLGAGWAVRKPLLQALGQRLVQPKLHVPLTGVTGNPDELPATPHETPQVPGR
ncbi:MAG: hypothetical protein SFY70_03285 [Bacteroidia bacterium]|nr:hypothetical protein [Bacteroidia bacterium]